jgi:hypothetical protein
MNFSFWAAKKKQLLLVLLILGVLFAAYNVHSRLTILFSKGQFVMNNHLVPEQIPINCGIIEMKSLPGKDHFALINGRNEFAVARLLRNGDLQVHTILHNYPNRDLEGSHLEGLYTDSDGKIFWSIATRGVFGVNSETKQTFDPLFATGGNTSLTSTIMVDGKDETILGEVMDLTGGGNGQLTVVLKKYNCKNDLLSEPTKPFDGFLFYLGNSEFLWCETSGSVGKVKWHLCDINLENVKHNKLTDEMTNKQISTWGPATPVSAKKRMMIGSIDANDHTTYYSVRWNSQMTEAKIEPLVIQIPSNGDFERRWCFSEDGSWLAATFTSFHPEEKKQIVFFSINDSFPQGISPPVFGEETYYEKNGVFVNHSELGPLYLDWPPQAGNGLLIYKLNDALKILQDKPLGK